MGLYGNILTAPDGSIFTFDALYTFGNNKSDELEKQMQLSSLAESDNIFPGRFVYFTDTHEIYMKSVITEERDNEIISTKIYVLIADLTFIEQIATATTDDWIEIIVDDNGNLSIKHRGPVVDLETASDKKMSYQEVNLISYIEQLIEENDVKDIYILTGLDSFTLASVNNGTLLNDEKGFKFNHQIYYTEQDGAYYRVGPEEKYNSSKDYYLRNYCFNFNITTTPKGLYCLEDGKYVKIVENSSFQYNETYFLGAETILTARKDLDFFEEIPMEDDETTYKNYIQDGVQLFIKLNETDIFTPVIPQASYNSSYVYYYRPYYKTAAFIPILKYDRKGHLYDLPTPIGQKSIKQINEITKQEEEIDFTLVLNGGGFLEKYLT